MSGITSHFRLKLLQRGFSCVLFSILLTLCGTLPAYADHEEKTEGARNGWYDPEPGAPAYDETSVFINVQRIGGVEIPAVIKDRVVYLPITAVFDYLKIKNESTPNFDSVFGYFIDPKAVYCIDNIRYQIRYKGTVYQLRPSDLILTESNLYLKYDYFSQVFGLTSSFDFSNLTVKMSASVELPAVREMQLEQMHRNVNRLRGEHKADTTIKRTYPLFNLGSADWNFYTTQQSDGKQDYRAGLALGAVIAGGEANVFLNYNSQAPFDERQQFYQWRFANNNHKALRQVTLGRIVTQAASSVYDPVIGVQVSNSPTTYRKSAGSYRLSRMTQPGWTVELYVNNVLVDFTKADASGFFSFDVPLVYGNSVIRLRYYGLYGEERTSEENITIPFNFLPKHELEYTASAGMVEDSLHSRFGRAVLNYGVSRSITIGAGTEYLSSIRSGANMPFATASLRLSNNLMLSGEYMHGLRSRGMLTYRMNKAQLELNYTKYDKEQRALFYNYLEERKITYSFPYQGRNFSGFTRFVLNQVIITENTSYNTAEWLISGSLRNLSLNVNTYMMSAGQKDPPRFDPFFYTNASLSWRFGKGWSFTPQTQYAFRDGAFISVKCDLEKFLFSKGYFNLSYEQNFKANTYSYGLGFRYDLPFARAGFTARRYNDVLAVTESGSGSLLFDRKTGFIGASNRQSVGRAGITLLPYLDINCNNRRDADEPRVAGLKAAIRSGRVQYNAEDTLIRLFDLEPYTNYFIDVSQNSFENISWQIKAKTMNVAVDPNQFKLIEIPVSVVSEAEGTVYLQDDSKQKGQGRINVCFFREDGSRAACALSEQDGYFSYMGLAPGTYIVKPDEEQLKNLHLSSSPERRITITASREGVLVDGLDFTLKGSLRVK